MGKEHNQQNQALLQLKLLKTKDNNLNNLQMETQDNKILQTQTKNKPQLSPKAQLRQLLQQQGKLQKAWKIELSLPKPILSRSIKNWKRKRAIENKLGIYCNIKCKS